MFTVLTFYRFVTIDDPEATCDAIERICSVAALKGTVLVATEGINVQLAGRTEAIDEALSALRRDARLVPVRVRLESSATLPFRRLRVRVRPEIVTFGRDADPETGGVRVDPKDWNALVDDPAVTLVDVRNDYEVAVGSFEGALDPGTATFGEFPAAIRARLDPADRPKVAMFCTGGIRCEKASAWLRASGFETVYQLEGGVLDYLAQVPADESRWRGDCFVFDERKAVGYVDLADPRAGRFPHASSPNLGSTRSDESDWRAES